jgi:hypothetical protein
MQKKNIEYTEGPQAGESFRKLATALFQVPKDGRKPKKKKQPPRKATSRKTRGKNKG